MTVSTDPPHARPTLKDHPKRHYPKKSLCRGGPACPAKSGQTRGDCLKTEVSVFFPVGALREAP
jgi:hypothetical protein